MNDLPHDGVSQGEMVVRAPWLTQGYLKDPVNSEKLWAGGWLHTGDIAVIDEEGYLKITDRIKDVIKTGGEWVSSLDLEDLILKHPGVVEAAVIGVPDPKWTERPLAVVVAEARAAASAGGDQDAPPGFRGQRRHLEIRGSGPRRLCRRNAQNQRRQARQKSVAREIRARNVHTHVALKRNSSRSKSMTDISCAACATCSL